MIVASEVLEHLWATEWAMSELVRVLQPGGRIAVTVPTRVPRAHLLGARLALPRHSRWPRAHLQAPPTSRRTSTRAGLTLRGRDHQHGLHSPYWWIRCAGGVNNPDRFLARKYHDLLVKQITDNPRWLAAIDRVLNPLIGKSLIVYARASERVSA